VGRVYYVDGGRAIRGCDVRALKCSQDTIKFGEKEGLFATLENEKWWPDKELLRDPTKSAQKSEGVALILAGRRNLTRTSVGNFYELLKSQALQQRGLPAGLTFVES
jgi:hypothetical protein